MKVFRNIAMLLLFSVSTNSFADKNNLRILTERFHDGRTFTSVSAAPYLNSQPSLSNGQKEKDHEIDWGGVAMALATGKVGFFARAINGDKSGKQSEKEVQTPVKVQRHITDDLAIYRNFYIEAIKEADKILRSKSPIDAFHALPEGYGAFMIELCGYVSLSNIIIEKVIVCENFLTFTIKEIINPKIREKNPLGFRSRKAGDLKMALEKHKKTESLYDTQEYIDGLVDTYIRHVGYSFK